MSPHDRDALPRHPILVPLVLAGGQGTRDAIIPESRQLLAAFVFRAIAIPAPARHQAPGGPTFGPRPAMKRTDYDFDVISGPSTPARPPVPQPAPAPAQPGGK
jgi:hypothetical protein